MLSHPNGETFLCGDEISRLNGEIFDRYDQTSHLFGGTFDRGGEISHPNGETFDRGGEISEFIHAAAWLQGYTLCSNMPGRCHCEMQYGVPVLKGRQVTAYGKTIRTQYDDR